MKARAGLLRAVKLTAAGMDLARRPPRGLTILIYHRVVPRPESQGEVSIPEFRAQMEYLASTGRVRDLTKAVEMIKGEPSVEPDPVAVTFDDGTSDFTDALPVLVEFGVPVTLYVATDFVERGAPFPWGAPPISWAGLKEAVCTGLVDVGSHTHSHALVDRLEPAVVEVELDRSIELISDRLGARPRHFAYPKAILGSSASRASVRRRFSTAAVGGMKANPYGKTDPYRLTRSAVQSADCMRYFERKVNGGMVLEGVLRERLNRRRHTVASV